MYSACLNFSSSSAYIIFDMENPSNNAFTDNALDLLSLAEASLVNQSNPAPSRSLRAVYIRSQRISESTRKTYASYIARFIEWIKQNHPEFYSNGHISLGNLSLEILDNFFVSQKSRKRGNETENATIHVLSTFRAAIRSMFVDQNVEVPAWYDKELSPLFQGLKKINAKKNKDEGFREEGKHPLSFSLYRFLMLFILKNEPNPFSHLFGILSWNLMCRGDNTAELSIHNLGWYEDSLTVKFGKAKNDQSGEMSISKEEKHVYANPLNPEICPVLSLAVYLSCCFPSSTENSLFLGTRQKDRMLGFLHTLMKKPAVRAHLSLHGFEPSDFGNHSFRKGAATFASSGSVGGPSIVSIIRRAGWSLGDVLGRYLKADPAGDQYVGRVVAGLPINSPQFAVLPPSFVLGELEVEEKVRSVRLTDFIFPLLQNFSNCIVHLHKLVSALSNVHIIYVP
jgi:hypothetical protein